MNIPCSERDCRNYAVGSCECGKAFCISDGKKHYENSILLDHTNFVVNTRFKNHVSKEIFKRIESLQEKHKHLLQSLKDIIMKVEKMYLIEMDKVMKEIMILKSSYWKATKKSEILYSEYDDLLDYGEKNYRKSIGKFDNKAFFSIIDNYFKDYKIHVEKEPIYTYQSLDSCINWLAKNQLFIEGHTDSITSLHIDSDRKIIVTSSLDKFIKLWDLDTLKILKSVKAHNYKVSSAILFENRENYITASDDIEVKIWKFPELENPIILKLNNLSSTAIALNNDDTRLAVGYDDENLVLWDLSTYNVLHVYRMLFAKVIAMKITEDTDGEIIVTACDDHGIKILFLDRPEQKEVYRHTDILITSLLIFEDEIYYGMDTGDLGICKISDPNFFKIYRLHAKCISSLATTLEGEYLATGSFDRLVKTWNRSNLSLDNQQPEPICNFKGHTKSILSLCFISNNDKIFSGSSDCTARIWSIPKKKIDKIFPGHNGLITCIEFNEKNPQYFISGSTDKTARLWDLNSKSEIYVSGFHENTVRCVCFGREFSNIATEPIDIVTGSSDKILRKFLGLSKGAINHFGHSGTILYVITTKYEIPISYSEDRTARIWKGTENSIVVNSKQSYENNVIWYPELINYRSFFIN